MTLEEQQAVEASHKRLGDLERIFGRPRQASIEWCIRSENDEYIQKKVDSDKELECYLLIRHV